MSKKSLDKASIFTIMLIAVFAIVFFFLVRGPAGDASIDDVAASNNVVVKD